MTDDINELRNRYREVKAPAATSANVRASLAAKPSRGTYWLPATAMAVALLVAVLPVLMDVDNGVPATTTERPRPSLSALAGMVPKKPASRTTSLTQIRTLAKPKMPSKPRGQEPQANHPIHDDPFKENKHAFI